MKTKVKTIDIQAKEWFDKVNGNSYFSSIVTVNFGMKSEKQFNVPFEYGYGEQYKQESLLCLVSNKLIDTISSVKLREQGIILRSNIQTGCKKSEVKSFA